MTRFAKNCSAFAMGISLVTGSVASLEACPRGGSGGGGGYDGGGHRPAPVYHAPPIHHAPPVYHAPPVVHAIPQPPMMPFPPQHGPVPTQHVCDSWLPQSPQGGYPQQYPTQQYPTHQFPNQQGVPQQYPSQQGLPPQYSQQPGGQPQFPQQQMPGGQQQFAQRPTAPAGQPMQQGAPQGRPMPQGGQNFSQAAPQQNAAADASAEMTALQMLAGMSGPASQEVPAQAPVQMQAPVARAEAQQPQMEAPTSMQQTASAGPARVGVWVATIADQTTVRLDLRADGSFVWTANAKGKSSSFQGAYSVEGQSLTLTRSNDNQKLTGALTDQAGGFSFKLAGATDNGLNFTRG